MGLILRRRSQYVPMAMGKRQVRPVRRANGTKIIRNYPDHQSKSDSDGFEENKNDTDESNLEVYGPDENEPFRRKRRVLWERQVNIGEDTSDEEDEANEENQDTGQPDGKGKGKRDAKGTSKASGSLAVEVPPQPSNAPSPTPPSPPPPAISSAVPPPGPIGKNDRPERPPPPSSAPAPPPGPVPPPPPPPPPLPPPQTSIITFPLTQTSFITITESAKGKAPEPLPQITPPGILTPITSVMTSILIVTQSAQTVTLAPPIQGTTSTIVKPSSTTSSATESETMLISADTVKGMGLSDTAEKLLISLGVLGGVSILIAVAMIFLRRRKKLKQNPYVSKPTATTDQPNTSIPYHSRSPKHDLQQEDTAPPQYYSSEFASDHRNENWPLSEKRESITAVPQIRPTGPKFVEVHPDPANSSQLQVGAFGSRGRTLSSAINSFIEKTKRLSDGQYKISP